MNKLSSPLSVIWLLLCAAGGGMLGAVMLRMTAPHATPGALSQLPDVLKLPVAAGAITGAVVVVLIGYLALVLDGRLAAWSASSGFGATLRAAASIVFGALVCSLLGLVIVINDYDEVRVALLDFHGAPLIIGGLLGGALGGLRGVAASPLNPLWLALLAGLGVAVVGTSAGFGVGLGAGWLLIQYMLSVGG